MRFYAVVNTRDDDFCFFDENLNMFMRRSVECGSGPRRIAAAGGSLYIACAYSGSVVKYDIESDTSSEVQICDYLTGIACINGTVAAACGGAGSIIQLDADLSLIRTAKCGDYPLSLCEKNGILTAACIHDGAVCCFDDELNCIFTLQIDGNAYYACRDSAGCIYCAHSNAVSKYSKNGEKVFSYKTGAMPASLCLSSDESRLAIGRLGCGGVDIIDTIGGKKTASIDEIPAPDDIVCTKNAWLITGMTDASLTLADYSGKIILRQNTGREPRGIALSE